MKAYHFTGETLRNGDPIPKIGKWLHYKGSIVPCGSGLHASKHPFDALQYAPGCYLHLVELKGGLVSHGSPADKWVGSSRKIIASINATPLLWRFAQIQALSVAHLWDAPDAVLEYLFTGDEGLRAAARDAAWAAAWDAEWDAARGAARGAAWAAELGAAWDAAWGAAWDAARDAARDAAWDAAWGAARGAAWAAARGAARGAAWAAARGAARNLFAELVNEAFGEVK